ncbi:MAG: YciI family protein [Pseudomonadota bacterium]
MKVMVFVKASASSEASAMPSAELIGAMMKFNQELMEAGVLLGGDGLQASVKGKRVQFSGSKRTVLDGPFAETKELVAGYWLWEVKSMEDAVNWVKRCPNPMPEDSEIEIRGILSPEDFGEAFTPEHQATYAEMQKKL